jgi:hypothetical protein
LERNPGQVLDATSSMPHHELACRVGVLNHLLQRVVEPLPIPSAPAPPLTALTLQQEGLQTILHVKCLRQQDVRTSEAMAEAMATVATRDR